MENELFQSCQTRTVTVKKPVKVKTVKVDGKKRLEEERIEYAEEEVVVPANTTAQIFYLKNRKPDKWKDKPQENTTEAQNNDMQTLADLLQHPVPDRDIKDFETWSQSVKQSSMSTLMGSDRVGAQKMRFPMRMDSPKGTSFTM